MRPVALFDLGNTLISWDHVGFAKKKAPGVLAEYRRVQSIQSHIAYEELLIEGVRSGELEVEAMSGTREKLTEMMEVGIESDVYSTCPEEETDLILVRTGLRPFIRRLYSTFIFGESWDCKDYKTRCAFQNISSFLSQHVDDQMLREVVLFADDKPAELVRARDGLGETVDLYCVGGLASGDQISISSIAEIDHHQYLRKD